VDVGDASVGGFRHLKLRRLVESDLAGIERDAEAAGAPWTPGRLPDGKPE
jgi:hypothetical protein